MPRVVCKKPPEKPGEEFCISIFDDDETIHEHVQPEDFTPPKSKLGNTC